MKKFSQFVREQEDTEAWDRQVEAGKRARAVGQIGNRMSKRPMNNRAEDEERKQWSRDVISGKPTSRTPAAEYNLMYSKQRERQNVVNRINSDIRSAEPGSIDARTGKPYVKPEPEQVPLTGRVSQAELNKKATERESQQ